VSTANFRSGAIVKPADIICNRVVGGALECGIDFTHALTFANASRHICEERPDLWPRAALQLALFVGRNRKYDGKQVLVIAQAASWFAPCSAGARLRRRRKLTSGSRR
jgi:hypothetical protein